MVKSAVFTDPSDQCAWFYLRFFLLQRLNKAQKSDMMNCLKELQDEEPDCECISPINGLL